MKVVVSTVPCKLLCESAHFGKLVLREAAEYRFSPFSPRIGVGPSTRRLKGSETHRIDQQDSKASTALSSSRPPRRKAET
jgi:hypothetical protein